MLFGRGLFWPFVPRVGQRRAHRDRRLGAGRRRVVTRRPRLVSGRQRRWSSSRWRCRWPGSRTGLSQTEQFRAKPESVVGQEVLAEHFPAGASQPTTVLATAAAAERRTPGGRRGVDGVQRVVPAGGDDSPAELSVVLDADPGSAAAFDQVRAVRDAARSADPGAPGRRRRRARRSTRRAAAVARPAAGDPADPRLVVLVVLLLLLRSVVAAVLLVLTVVATFAASLGVELVRLRARSRLPGARPSACRC